jgi:hypothetical protein
LIGGDGDGAVMNYCPELYAPRFGLGAAHLPGQKVVIFNVDGKHVIVSEMYGFVDGSLAPRQDVRLLAEKFIEMLQERSRKYRL